MTDAIASILLVEDDPMLRHAFRLLLEDAGYAVEEAGSADEAVTAFANRQPDLVILDIGLPDRSGLEVCREIRSQPGTAGVPVVALTGRTGADEQRACMDAGCTDYLSKPVEPRELLRRLPQLMRR
jgi:DNA-binding response OmpR family regulator